MSSDQEQNEVEMEEQVETKRGRGRPRKAGSKAKVVEKTSGEPAVKRGRGRPASKGNAAKTSVDATNGNGDVEEAGKAEPKRRGRAKAAPKEPEPESEEEPSDEEDEKPSSPLPAKAKKAAGKKGAKNGHVEEEEDDEAEDDEAEGSVKSAVSSDQRIKIVVEHCKSCHTFRKKAEDIISALKEKWSNIEVEYNPKPPRKGSFEINLIGNKGKDVKLWTGFDLGPPRKLKFPEPDLVVEAMEKAYVPESA